MKDLVETVIGQLMRQDAYASSSPARMPDAAARRVQYLNPAGGTRGATPPENDPLWRASRQFESLFVEQMLTSMRKTVPDSGLLKKGLAEGVSNTMLDQAIADSIGRQGRMGIASSLYRQLSGDHPAAQANAQNGDTQETPMTLDPLREAGRIGQQGDEHGAY